MYHEIRSASVSAPELIHWKVVKALDRHEHDCVTQSATITYKDDDKIVVIGRA